MFWNKLFNETLSCYLLLLEGLQQGVELYVVLLLPADQLQELVELDAEVDPILSDRLHQLQHLPV